MKLTTRRKRFRDISIAKKLYFIVGAMAVLIAIELLTLWFAIHTLSSVRAFIAAEGLWSKAQKDAVYHLGRYERTHNEKDYMAFKEFMKVPEGDHKARIELFREDPNLDIVRNGFLEGRIHPGDIDGMVRLVRNFHTNYYISKALGYWGQGDSLIAYLTPIADEMRLQISSGTASQDKLNQLVLNIDGLNEQLTTLEDNFSFTLEEGSRWMENLILKILFSVTLTVEITGLLLTVLVTRNITRGLKEINRVADKITNGHFNERVTVFAKDEIGQVATSVNRMTEQLIISNRELENFAFVASHDLQEPLRKISVFTDLLEEQDANITKGKNSDYIRKISNSVSRMRRLIEDILKFASVGPSKDFTPVDLHKIISGIVTEMEIGISTVNATITVGGFPIIEANASQMGQLFQNLLNNALKFSKTDPVITISGELIDESSLPDEYKLKVLSPFSTSKKHNDNPHRFCKIYVQDNGIGFEEIYKEKIFIAFQRLHGKHTYEGTGIGLAICHRIVETHHGIIYAESIPGTGTTFIIILPVQQKQFENT